MDKFAQNLYDLRDECVAAKIVSSRDVVRPKPPLDYQFRDSVIGSSNVVLFGRLEPSTSIALHLLRPDYKPNGWFRLTCPRDWGFGAAKLLYEMQLGTLKELVERDADRKVPILTWITGEEEKDILIYIDFASITVYAPWEQSNGIGLLASEWVDGQDKLLRQTAHHPVHITAQLQHISKFTEGFQAFIVKVGRVDIIPVG